GTAATSSASSGHCPRVPRTSIAAWTSWATLSPRWSAILNISPPEPTMHTLLKLPNARKVVTQLGQVKPGMEVLVLYDYYTAHNVEPLAIALQEAGAQAQLLQIAGSTHHGTQFSETVAQAMRASNLVIALTRANAAHTEARQQATRNGVGVIVLPESDAA